MELCAGAALRELQRTFGNDRISTDDLYFAFP